jgi:Asp-tRNA(Asn)/Glu-tRNA(Gln) amidotransferase A subunit family amidase
MALCWSLDKIGPICRAVEDTALVLAALNGEDPDDPASISFGFEYDGNLDLGKLVIGYDPEVYANGNPVDKTAIDVAKTLGAKMLAVTPPGRDVSSLPLQLSAEAAAAFEQLTLTGKDELLRRQIKNAWPHSFRLARFISAVDLVQVDRLRRRSMQDMDSLFKQCDVYLGPNFGSSLNLVTNFTGHPQLTLRAGFEDRKIQPAYGHDVDDDVMGRHLPRNISLWAPLFEEGQMLAVGRELEKALNAGEQHPKLA